MRLVHSLNPGFLLSVFSVAVLAAGCSLFGSRSDEPPRESGSFQSNSMTAASTTSLIPVPVDVASDIAKIAAGGTVAPTPATMAGREPSAATAKENAVKDADGEATEPESTPGSSFAGKKYHGKSGQYKVRSGDTLMKISFAKYGTVYRWREILAANRAQLSDYSHLVAGTVLRINDTNYVVIERNGKPYLIRQADTLVKISNKLYGTTHEWQRLWHNNRQLIHNPNLIFAGFTLYYQNLHLTPAPLRPPASLHQ